MLGKTVPSHEGHEIAWNNVKLYSLVVIIQKLSLVHPKMKILSITPPYVVPNL